MPWTDAARREYRRKTSRYASDMTDAEWALIEPFMPPKNRLGRPRTADLREVMNAILYMASTGCQWVMIPKDLPHYSTVQRYFYDWRDSGLLETMRFMLAMETSSENRKASGCGKDKDSQQRVAFGNENRNITHTSRGVSSEKARNDHFIHRCRRLPGQDGSRACCHPPGPANETCVQWWPPPLNQPACGDGNRR